MAELQYNDKVDGDYEVFICVEEEKKDMLAVVSEKLKFGYEKVADLYDEGNYIVILCKRKNK